MDFKWHFFSNLNGNDLRGLLQVHSDATAGAPRGSDDQIKKAAALIKRIDLKDFSVFQFANPGKLSLIAWY